MHTTTSHNAAIHLLDDRVVESTSGVELRPGEPRKRSTEVLSLNDRPWEGGGDNGYPNIAFDPGTGLFKMWYSGFVDLRRDSRSIVCYAESSDGLNWRKPELGLWEHNGSKANNIVAPFLAGVGVARDDQEQDPSRRYKMVYLIHTALSPQWAAELMAANFPCDLTVRGVGVAFSGDGIHWDFPPGNPVLRGVAGDTHNHWHRGPDGKGFVLITRRNRPWRDGTARPQKTWKTGQVQIVQSESERVVKRWLSDDFIRWHSGTDVFEAQGDEVGIRQYYSMPAIRVGGGYLGLLSLFNSQPDDDSVDLELAWSPDLTRWKRIAPGQPFIARGAGNEPDAGTIYAAWQPSLLVGDEHWIYYAASPKTHSGGPTRHNTLRLATLPRDRWAGWHAGETGQLITRPLDLGAGELLLNLAAQDGEAVVELQNEQGQPLAGFEAEACVPLRGDHVAMPVQWRGNSTGKLPDRSTVRVAIHMRHAAVFSVMTRSA